MFSPRILAHGRIAPGAGCVSPRACPLLTGEIPARREREFFSFGSAERKAMILASPLLTTYGAPVDREWAYELLRGKPASTQSAPGAANDWGNHGGGQTQRRPAPQLRERAPAP